MKVKMFAAMLAVLLLCSLVSAQGYYIQVTFNTNLRASHSLEADIVETAPAGTTLHVVDQLGRWLTINRNGNEVWMAGWVSHTRVDSGGQTSSQSGTTAQIDNCCFVDRQCNSDQEWTDGYWAFQNGQCAAPTQSQSETSTQPAGDETGPTDNCCFVDRQCNSEYEWVVGFYAYQHNQCGTAPPSGIFTSCCQLGWNCTIEADRIIGQWVIEDGFDCEAPIQVAFGRTILEGSDEFITQVTAALEYLRSRVPHWYAFIVNGVPKIRGGPWGPGTFAVAGAFNIAPPHASEGAVVLSGTLLHEACHVNRDNDGSGATTGVHDTVPDFSIEENICETMREAAMTEANPARPTNPYLEAAIAFFYNHGGRYDFQAAANGQRDRAFWLLSQGI